MFQLNIKLVLFFFSLLIYFFYRQAAEIQRVWNLHDVLLSVDYAAEETKGMINLLEDGFVCPSFFRNDDVSGAIVSPDCLHSSLLAVNCLILVILSQGKRFLVFLFSWNVDFIWAIHATIKNQLDYLSK